MKNTRSPITQIPLRNPGEGLLQRRMLMVMEGIGIWIIALGIAGIFTAIEWIRWFREVPPRPFVSTALFLALGIFVVVHVRRVIKKIHNYDLGLLGERYMGERLGELYGDGYHIIHDVPCKRMNIDHIVIGPTGIFTIETKMARKEIDQLNEIVHTDKGVLVNGKRGWAGKAVWEAQKEVENLREILTKDGGICPHIQPIVVYPGWFVKDDCSRKVWVLNDRYLVKKIRSLPITLSSENMKDIRRMIEIYVRKKTEEMDYA